MTVPLPQPHGLLDTAVFCNKKEINVFLCVLEMINVF